MRRVKKILFNLIMKHLFLAVVEEDVIPWRELSKEEQKAIIMESHFFLQSLLWERIVKSSKHKAQIQMFEKSQSWDDMYFGKAMLYVIDLMDKRIKAVSKLRKISD